MKNETTKILGEILTVIDKLNDRIGRLEEYSFDYVECMTEVNRISCKLLESELDPDSIE